MVTRLRRVLQAVERAGRLVAHQARLADDRGVLRRGQRDLDHLDPPLRRVRVGGRAVVASRHGARGPDAGRSLDIDVDVVRIVVVGHQGVGVRAAARLNSGHLDR